jgi:O-antigen ligase
MIWLLGFYMWLFVHRPFEYYRELGALQVERWYMLFVLVCWLVAPGKVWPVNRMHLAVCVFLLAVAMAWGVSPFAALPECTDVVENVGKMLVFYFLVVTCVRDERDLKLLVLFFIGAVGLYMAHSLLEYCHGRYEWRMGISRMMGVDATNSNPNAFAATLVFALPLTLPLWASRPSPTIRLALLGFTVAAVACVLLTGSRAGFIGLVAFGLLYLYGSNRRKAGILLVAGAACVAALALPGELQNRFLTLIDPSVGPANAETSAQGRLEGFLSGVKLWLTSPLTGTGLSTFAALTGREGAAHNLYGQVLSEMGLIGAAALVCLLLAFRGNALEVRRFYRRHPDVARDLPYHVSRAVSMAVLLLLLMGWSGHIMFRYNWLWFGAFQVVTVHCVRRKAAVLARQPRGVVRLPYLGGPHWRGAAARYRAEPES